MKQKTKKVLSWMCAGLCFFACILSQGCGVLTGAPLDAGDLSIDDFGWGSARAKYNGRDCYSFSLTNNSDYDIIAVQITYKVKDPVSDASLKVYDEFMKSHEGYIEETDSPRDVILRSSKNVLVAKGEKLTGMRLTIGFQDWSWYSYPTDAQFELMTPKELEIGVVGKDNLLYIAYYDFESDTWTLDETTAPVDVWPETEIAKKISNPNENHYVVRTNKDDSFEFYSYGVTSEEYSQYIKALVAAGFTEESKSDSHFEGTDADGYEVDLWYYDEEERLSVSIEKDS